MENFLIWLITASKESTLYWLLFSILASIVWIVYLTYYNSRLVGLILTLILNRFVPYGHIKLGSFSISVLSGKIMFRNFNWVTEDYSIRVKLGSVIFRYWWPLVNKDFDEDLSRSDTRLSVYLEKIEFHIYNYTSNYSRLEEIFGLDRVIDPTTKPDTPPKKTTRVEINRSKWAWRNLLPVIKVEVSDGRVIFGNYLMPQSLLMSSRDLQIVYTTKPASTPFDLFMHILKAKADNFKVMWVPSPKYTGKAEMPPRCMGEGFAVLQSNQVEFYYYQDEAGLVPYEPESVYLANGDVVSIRTWPCWGMDVKCGKNTDISYGPWCERQRYNLYNFFYPADYDPMRAQQPPVPGQMRVFRSFDFKLSVQNNTNIDLLFTKSTETQALHMVCKPGSYLEYTLPMFLDEDGYTFIVTGQLMHLETSTSLKFRNFIDCETLEFVIKSVYPSHWNDPQDYVYDFTACKATAHIIYQHKDFISDLLNDWASKERPDLFTFVPYTIEINFIIKEFEVVLMCNQWNWVDCFGTAAENSQMAVRGETFDLSVILPYDDYLPDTVTVKLFLRLESLEGLLYLPETHTSRHLLISLSENMKVMTREGDLKTGKQLHNSKKWHRACSRSDGWISVIGTPIVAFSLEYKYHPIPLLFTGKELGSFNVEEFDAEETMQNTFKLIPLRPMRAQAGNKNKGKANAAIPNQFDPSRMEPDKIFVECEIGPTVVYAYGSLVMFFLNFKENYLGDFQNISDLEKNIEPSTSTSYAKRSSLGTEDSSSGQEGDPRLYRPFSVIFHLTLHDIHGHLIKNCTPNGPPCPSFFLERLVFEMDKQYHETLLQVNLSSIMLVCMDTCERPLPHRHLNRGFLTLSSLQVRGHAMFSHEGLPMKAETLEYAWLIEVVIGDLVGRLTTVQLHGIVESLKTFIFLAEDKENKLVCPNAFELCQHMLDQNECVKTGNNLLSPCPTVTDLKYEFIRLSLDAVDIHFVESASALNLQIYPVRLSRCNLFSATSRENVTLLLPKVALKHYVSSKPVDSSDPEHLHTWLEVGGLKLGPVFIDLSKSLENRLLQGAQNDFLRLHDQRTKRLNFLWDSVKCGCVGGCNFFGNNRNGEHFFQPSSQDLADNVNVAVPHIFDTSEAGFGFQQSILKPSETIFSQKPLTAAEYLNEILKPNHGEESEEFALSGKRSLFPLEQKHMMAVKHLKSMDKRSQAARRDSLDDNSFMWRSRITLNSEVVEEGMDGDDSDDIIGDLLNSISSQDNDTETSSKHLPKSTFSRTRKLEKPVSESTLSSPALKIPAITFDKSVRSSVDLSNKVAKVDFKTFLGDLRRSGTLGMWQSEKELRAKVRSIRTRPLEKLFESQGSVYKNATEFTDKDSNDSDDSFKSAVNFDPSEDQVRTETVDLKPKSRKNSILSIVEPKLRTFNAFLEKILKPEEKKISNDRSTYSKRTDVPSSTWKPRHLKLEPQGASPTTSRLLSAESSLETTGLPSENILGSRPLIDCYKCYMGKHHCPNWSSALPVNTSLTSFHSDSRKLSAASKTYDIEELNYCVPHFVALSRGLDCHSIISDHSPKTHPSDHDKADTTHIFQRHIDMKFGADAFSAEKVMRRAEEARDERKVDDWVAVVQLDQSFDLMLSPIMLEAFNRYIDSIIPCLESMHPSSIIDLLHIDCLSTLSKQEDKNTTLTSCLNAFTETAEVTKTIDKYQCDNLHVKVNLPQINVSFLQVCSVNDKLFNVSKASDLASVSLLSVSFNNSTFSFFHKTEIKTTSTILMSNAKDSKNKKNNEASFFDGNLTMMNISNRIGVGRKKMADLRNRLKNTNTCIVKCKTFSESRKTDMVLQVNVSQMHVQLRRSKKISGSVEDLPSFTSIPPSSSRVFFRFKGAEEVPTEHPSVPYSWDLYKKEKYHRQEKRDKASSSHSVSVPKVAPESINDVIGLIMFECGLEAVSFDLAQRSGYADNSTAAKEVTTKSTLFKYASSPELSNDSSVNIKKSLSRPHERQRRVSKISAATFSDTLGAKMSRRASKGLRYDSLRSLAFVGCEQGALKGDATSAALEIKAVWFNFASPTSVKEMKYVTKKQNWNLLSTASPSILAWLQPCNKATSVANSAHDKFLRRQYLVMACLMTDALENQAIHLMTKSKYNKTSWESKYLQDEPSSQLLTALRRYVNSVGVDAVEGCMVGPSVPDNKTLKNGMLVLTRQWKNVLYLPMFDDHTFRSKKKVKVAYAVPLVHNHYYGASAGSLDDRLANEGMHASGGSYDAGASAGGGDVVDEKTSLLKTEGDTFLAPNPISGSESANQAPPLTQKPSPIDLVRIDTMGKFSFQDLEHEAATETATQPKRGGRREGGSNVSGDMSALSDHAFALFNKNNHNNNYNNNNNENNINNNNINNNTNIINSNDIINTSNTLNPNITINNNNNNNNFSYTACNNRNNLDDTIDLGVEANHSFSYVKFDNNLHSNKSNTSKNNFYNNNTHDNDKQNIFNNTANTSFFNNTSNYNPSSNNNYDNNYNPNNNYDNNYNPSNNYNPNPNLNNNIDPTHEPSVFFLPSSRNKHITDLQHWMRKQQESVSNNNNANNNNNNTNNNAADNHSPLFRKRGDAEVQRRGNTASKNTNQTVLASSSLQLIDSQVLFKPLLDSMGLDLHPVKMSTIMKKFGGELSALAFLKELRVEIVESETTNGSRLHKKKTSASRTKTSLLCRSFKVTLSMIDILDYEEPFTGQRLNVPHSKYDLYPENEPVLLKSVRLNPGILDQFENKHVTTKVNFEVMSESVTQHVNMSLLRLVHQFVTMVQCLATSQCTHKTDSPININTPQSTTEPPTTNLFTPTTPPAPPKTPFTPVFFTPPFPPVTSKTTKLSVFSKSVSPPTSPKTHFSPKSPKVQRISPSSKSRVSPTSKRVPFMPPIILPRASTTVPPHFSPRTSPRPSSELFLHLPGPTASHPLMQTVSQPFNPFLTQEASIPLVMSSSAPSTYDAIDIMEKGEGARLSRSFTGGSASYKEVFPPYPSKPPPRLALPKCWENLYHLLNLYNNMVDPNKTFERPVISMIEEGNKDLFRTRRRHFFKSSPVTRNMTARERLPIILFGSVHLKRIHISAVLSGLKLQADLKTGHAGFTHKEKLIGFAKKKCTESSMSLSIDNTNLTLFEGVQSSSQQTVVSIEISRSNALFSSFIKRLSSNTFCLLHLGVISINIPQHPVALHTMVVHSSKRLSNTLQEFLNTAYKKSAENTTNSNMTSMPQNDSSARAPDTSKQPTNTYPPSRGHPLAAHNLPQTAQATFPSNAFNSNANTPLDSGSLPKETPKISSRPIDIHFHAKLMGFIIEASLLPSLKAQYKMKEVTSSGVVGVKSKFIINLLHHSLSFSSQVNVTSILPDSASIGLPHITVKGEYRQFQDQVVGTRTQKNAHYLHSQVHQLHIPHKESSRLVLREGDYLKATADIGAFVHVLTTDLLNHLVFIQKVFMKEINEVVQRVSGSDQPVQIWAENFGLQTSSSKKPLLYSFLLKMKGVQITATTPTSNAVRFETGEIDVELSNRVEKALKADTSPTPAQEPPRKKTNTERRWSAGFFFREPTVPKPDATPPNYVYSVSASQTPPKIFFQVKVNLNLALGTLIRHPVFEEAEPEFPHLASFSTSILLRNALQDEMIAGATMDQEALLINLKRPIIFVLPSAFDKAILVWLNYRNAYEYWSEQRMGLNSEIKVATKQVFTRLPSPVSETSLSVLFLQITIDDLGICLPMAPFTHTGISSSAGTKEDVGSYGALVLTLEKTQISACSFKSFVCKGRFTDFCLRFAEDFHITYDDWKPEKLNEYVMNALVVPNGTFELCSRTDNRKQSLDSSSISRVNAKWILNILWKMKGIDIHLDTSIGKKLNVVWNTLTSLAGDVASTDESQFNHVQEVEQPSRKQSLLYDDLPDFVYNDNLDSKTRTRLIEKEMNEQAKVVQDLKALGASRNTVEEEENKLKGLQKALFIDFRKDILKKFKHPTTRLSATDALIRGSKHFRASSVAGATADSLTSTTTRTIDRVYADPPTTHLRTHSADVGHLQPSSHEIFKSLSSNDSSYGNQSSPSKASSERINEAKTFDIALLPVYKRHRYSSKMRPVRQRMSGVVLENISDVENEETEDSNETSSEGSVIQELRSLSPQGNNQQIVEPAIDFELDVKAEIESGKCVLHPKEVRQESEQEAQNKARDKTAGSPKGPDKKKPTAKRGNDLYSSKNINRSMANNTVFFIPGVEVKLHYNSKTISSVETLLNPIGSERFKRFMGVKKANLYAWLSIQKLPEEMLISTSILDFLEQAIEPIESFKRLYSQSDENVNDSQDEGFLNTREQSSFPVEVVVSVQVQPSVIRLTCLPLSRVECLFQLPSLDVIFSTKKIDQKNQNTFDPNAHGGLCVSVCMTNISLYIFHPYGGGQRKPATFASMQESSPLRGSETNAASVIESRKDSLSLNIEFLKLNISRSRKVSPRNSNASYSKLDKNLINLSNNVRFSLICNIGSASFKYDMRKLTEILALPKAWYRRSLARRLFLGEEMTAYDSESQSEDGDDLSASSSESSMMDPSPEEENHKPSIIRAHSKNKKTKSKSEPYRKSMLSPSKVGKTSNAWQTLVLFSINLPQLDVMINMSNAMGNTIWSTKGLQYHSRLMVDSAGFKNANMYVGLSNSKLESKGGIIGGLIELEDVYSQIFVKEDPGREPEHKMSVSLHTLEIRLDYMGSTFLIGRLSELLFQLKDEWKFKVENQTKVVQSQQDAVSLMMFVHCKLSLDRFHLMISKSTTPDFLKMVHKLEEFFSQQLTSGKRVLLTFATSSRSKRKDDAASLTLHTDSSILEPKQYRHWQAVFSALTCCKLALFPFSMPNMRAIVGGSVNIVGKNITLACFHGVNFRSKSWALFTMDEPNIMFETEAVNLSEEEAMHTTHIVQSLCFQLRGNDNDMSRKNKMATVYKLSRGYYMPPAFTSVQDWFHYAFATSDSKGLDSFPNADGTPVKKTSNQMVATTTPTTAATTTTTTAAADTDKKSITRRVVYKHETETIFILPSFRMDLKTFHTQEEKPPEIDYKPVVECSFVADFDDHIFVAMDAEAVLFLHDLITNYIKEKDKVADKTKTTEAEKAKQSEVPLKVRDLRQFDCKTWHLEPTVRLLSWGGKEIDPVGVDYILQKLGFQHARMTIPKWMQRGCMDPIDKILSLLAHRLIISLQDNK